MTTDLIQFYLVDFIDVTLAYEDANSKLVDVDDEDGVGNSLMHTWEFRQDF